MVTTITTTTTLIVTTVAAAAFAIIAIVTFIVVMIQKEITSELESTQAKRLSQALNIALVPMLVIFFTIFCAKIFDALK
jgi:hypothetical protein